MNEEGSERGRKLRVGIFVLVGVAAFLGMVYALGARARLFEPRFTIHADFTEVGGLVEGATVRLAGVQIGRVSGVNLPPEPGGKVRVDMTIAKRYGDRIRHDSVARIETQGLLGDRIVEITVGTAQARPVKASDVIASRDPFDITKVMSESAGVVKSASALADSLKQTADQLNKSHLIEEAAATVASARKITDQVGRVVTEVERGKGWAHVLVYEEPVALRRLNDLVASTQTLVERVQRGEGAAGVLTSEQSTAAAKRFVAASLKGWAYCRDSASACVDTVLKNGSTLGKGHQTWQMNEINALIWPAPKGVGVMDPAAYETTAKIAQQFKVIKKAPTAGAYRTDIAKAAVASLKKDGVDVFGKSWHKASIKVTPGGK